MSFDLESTIKNQKSQIVKTDFAVESGLGTAMHSKPGQQTIVAYKAFQNPVDRDDFLKPFQENKEKYKQARLLEALTMVEVDIIKQGFQVDLSEIRKVQQDNLYVKKRVATPPKDDAPEGAPDEDFLA